jgi:hypothetical protein
MRTCCDCAVVVWIGDEQECPKDVQLSYPKDADWTDVAEPYCKACWEIESAVLHKMSAEHKAIGPKEKPAAKPKPAAAKPKPAPAKPTPAPAKPKPAIASTTANQALLQM